MSDSEDLSRLRAEHNELREAIEKVGSALLNAQCETGMAKAQARGLVEGIEKAPRWRYSNDGLAVDPSGHWVHIDALQIVLEGDDFHPLIAKKLDGGGQKEKL